MAIDGKILISGAGIAGLTLAVLLKEQGHDLLVVEHDEAVPTEGYMMDFFGSGWDVAERMGLTDKLRALHYPIDALQFVGELGDVYASVPISRVTDALGGKYVYLRRRDLVRILYERAQSLGVEVRFDTEITELEDTGKHVEVAFDYGSDGFFALVFGADGVHSGVRSLVFGEERQFARYLGAYVAAFHLADHDFPVGRAMKLHEETDRVAAYYPLDDKRLDATYVFRHELSNVSYEDRLDFVREAYKGAGWIGEAMLDAYQGREPIFFDTLTQIAMPRWSRGRVALLGDACGCLTLLAGQGSHMAMAGAYVIARELKRYKGNHAAAFTAYEARLKPAVAARQEDAATFAKVFIPSETSRPWLRRLVIKLIFSPLVLPLVFKAFGAKSVLESYT
jgi:2-polyprenyl-6-methoxyphenol hydroxylase-like FAD-dependent oxidoreductase